VRQMAGEVELAAVGGDSDGGFGTDPERIEAAVRDLDVEEVLVFMDLGSAVLSAETVLDGSYPLSRPLFIYVKKESLAKPEAKEMMKYVLGDEGRSITTEVGYVELEDKDYAEQLAKLGA